MSELGVRLREEETRMRNISEEKQIGQWVENLRALRIDERDREMMKQVSRKCICCGAPWYEVDH